MEIFSGGKTAVAAMPGGWAVSGGRQLVMLCGRRLWEVGEQLGAPVHGVSNPQGTCVRFLRPQQMTASSVVSNTH